jgi:enoyl-CoA hydratase
MASRTPSLYWAPSIRAEEALMPRASDLRLNAIKLAQDGRVLTATAVAPPLDFVTTEFIRDLDRLTAAVDTDDSVGAVVQTQRSGP